jgi:hypothetical protein
MQSECDWCDKPATTVKVNRYAGTVPMTDPEQGHASRDVFARIDGQTVEWRYPACAKHAK